jgi:hypothetical protein
MSRKGTIGYHFLGGKLGDSAPLRVTAARRDARPTTERRAHALGVKRKKGPLGPFERNFCGRGLVVQNQEVTTARLATGQTNVVFAFHV